MIEPLIPCLLGAYVLDLLLGDPRWLPHPVRLFGFAARVLETVVTAILGRNRFSGSVFTLLIVGGAGAGTWALIRFLTQVHPWLGLGVTVYLLYTSFAARDLDRHASRVQAALTDGDLDEARRRLSLIVGRDTAVLDERGIVRAAVESVAESTLDGVIAPLFYAAIGGAPAAMAFKAASTLDSMVGHKTERYLRFGWASARLDDGLNWLPARLAKLLYPLASLIVGLRTGGTWTVAWRDGGNHPSPNAGISEAAMAGALGVRLGGSSSYEGAVEERPTLGDPLRELEAADIRRSVAWMYASSVLALVLFAGGRAAVVHFLHPSS